MHLASEAAKTTFGSAVTRPVNPLSFRKYVETVKPKFRWFYHNIRVAEVLQRVADDQLKRVMFFWPPRHGKSEEISRLFSAYYLYRHPDRFVGLSSYSAGLAYTLSRSARENFKAGGGETKSDANAVQQWETTAGGGFWAAGVGGAITGKGFHLGIIDDPLKNAQDASSEVIREGQKEWYASTFYTREEPGGAIIVVQTRWHEDDLSGWLLSQEGADDEPENWHIVNLPAIAEADAQVFPDTCTVEPDWRKPGEPLCPERYASAKLRKIEKRVGDYVWGALYQQRPTAKDGAFFKVGEIKKVSLAPPGLRAARGWDIAATEGAGDYSAGIKLAGPDREGFYYILDVQRGQLGTDNRNALLKRITERDGVLVTVRLPQDPGAAGKSLGLSFVTLLAGFAVKVRTVSGDKETRADPFSAQVNAGKVKIVEAPWNNAYIEELRSFPRGKHDDQVDGSADAFDELTKVKPFESAGGGAMPHLTGYQPR